MLLAAVLFFAGCAQMSARKPAATGSPTSADSAVVKIVTELARLNQSLLSFKGVGKLTVRRKGVVQLQERVAWIGASPDKLSVVVFVSGFSTVRFATDGSWLYTVEPGESAPAIRKFRATESALAKIIGIKISSEEIVALLSGRVPLADFRSARLRPGTGAEGDVLALRSAWGVHQRIRLETGSSRPLQMEHYERSGAQRYRAVFAETMTVDAYRVPLHLSIMADEDTEFSLVIERYWPNVEVSPAMFVLNPIR